MFYKKVASIRQLFFEKNLFCWGRNPNLQDMHVILNLIQDLSIYPVRAFNNKSKKARKRSPLALNEMINI